MKVQIKKVNACERILEIEIPGELMQEAFEAVINRFQKHTAIPGFRQGKVPREILLKRFGKDIKGEVLSNKIPDSYLAALKQTNLWPLGDPEISKVNWNPVEPLSFEAKVEIKPDVKLGHYKGLRIKKEILPVSESEIDNEIKNIQEKMAVFNLVTGRPLQKGDLAIVDLEIYVKGKLIPGGKAGDFSLEVGKDLFGADFDKELLGLKIGEKKTIETTLPENHPSPELQKQKASFQIALKQIKEKELPAVDDELARRVKECQGLEDLKEKIKKRLTSWKEAESRRKMQEELIAQLLKSTSFPLPLSLISRRKKVLLEYTLNHLKKMGFPEKRIREEEKELEKESEKKAEEEVKLSLILEAIADKEQIIVGREEAKEEFEKLKQHSNKTDSEEEISSGFISQLRHNKVIKFLLTSAKIQEVKA